MADEATGSSSRRARPRASGKAARTLPALPAKKPIDVYYWPTPNGWKITIMLEECGLPYQVDARQYCQGRPVRAGLPGDLAEQSNAGDRGSRRSRAAGRSRSLNPAPSCSISGARPAGCIRRTSARASRSTSGCSGRWPTSAPRRARPITSAVMRRKSCHTRSIASPNEMNCIYGVMNVRLEDRDFLAGRYSIADIACVGWVSRAERFGHDLS